MCRDNFTRIYLRVFLMVIVIVMRDLVLAFHPLYDNIVSCTIHYFGLNKNKY